MLQLQLLKEQAGGTADKQKTRVIEWNEPEQYLSLYLYLYL